MNGKMQLSLFDLFAVDTKNQQKRILDADLDDWALVYLVTFHGGNQGNLFILKIEDAQKLCEDECSHGANGGYNRWMFQWTKLSHFISQNDTYDGRLENFVFIYDTGRQDADFERLGIAKPTLKEMQELLNSMGYQLVYKCPRRTARQDMECLQEGEE